MANDIEKKIRIVYTVDGAERVATSLKEIRAGAAELRKNFANATDVAQLQKYGAEINNVKEKMNELTATGRGWSSGSVTGASNVAQAFQAMNYVVRDSPYFFKNFALGVLAVGNNINPLIDAIIRARQESQKLGVSLGREMLNFLKGPGGIIFGFSLLVTAIQAYVFSMDGAKKKTKELKEELTELEKAFNSIAKLKNPFDDLFFNIKPEDTQRIISALDAEIKMREKLIGQESIGAILGKPMVAASQSAQSQEQLKALNEFDKSSAKVTKRLTDQNQLNKDITKQLKEQKAAYEAQLIVGKKLEELGLTAEDKKKPRAAKEFTLVENLKLEREIAESQGKNLKEIIQKQVIILENESKRTKDLREQLKLYSEINSLNSELAQIIKKEGEEAEKTQKQIERMFAVIEKANSKGTYFGTPEQLKRIMDKGAPLGTTKKYEEEIERQRELYEDLAGSVAGVFEDNMMTMWRNVFGEANSLVEQLGQALASVLVNRAANSIADSLIGAIIGTATGGPIGGIIGFLGGAPAKQGNTPVVVVNQVDGRTISKIQYNALPGQVARLQREGYMN